MTDQTPTSEPTVVDPVLTEAKMNLVTVKAPVKATVISNDSCMKGKSASIVRHTEIDVSGTPLAGNFKAGQSFGVIAPGVDAAGKPHKVRLYSIACPTWGEDGNGNVLSTTPKRLIEEFKPQKPGENSDKHTLFVGVCSNFLCDLNPGDKVQVTGPNGKRFLLPANPDNYDYLFIAAGTGIAPFRGFLQELLERPGGPTPSRIHLIMGSPYTTDLLYDDLFRRLDEEHDTFSYHTAISRETRAGGKRGIYVHHLLEEQIETFRPMLKNPRTLIYVCGLIGMQIGLYQVLARQQLGDGFMTVGEELAGIDPADWPYDQIKRRIRPTKRLMLEVY